MGRKKIPEEEKIKYSPMLINVPESIFSDFTGKIDRESLDRTKLIRRWIDNWTYRGDPNKDTE